jgi:amino acid adenylation domain-containing protein/non-ribosomal peptide synthase protein (TIGR01720 family)
MTDIADRLAQLTPQQRELVLERLRSQKRDGAAMPAADGPRPLAAGEPIPLSFAQQRLWFLDQYEGPNATYNMRAAVRLAGSLDQAALERSIEEIVRRHAVLRTMFAVEGGNPVQIVRPTLKPEIKVADLSHLPVGERDSEVRRVLDIEPARPFDLTAGPLLRIVLLRLAAREHVLLLVVHHIVCDGWSIGVLVHEFTELYRAFLAGAASPLPPLSLQYGDYAAWHRRWLSGDRLVRQLDFWKRMLADAPPLLLLPTDRLRPAEASGGGTVERFRVDERLGQKLAEIARGGGASLSMLLFAAYGLLLGRLSGMEDLVIGMSVANRDRPEFESLIGFFVNILPLRFDLSGNPSFTALLDRVKHAMLDALSNQDLPFERLVEELKPERQLGHNALVQTVFNMQSAASGEPDLPGLTLSAYDMARTASLFDLTLNVAEQGNGALALEWEYATDLFDAATVRRFGARFLAMLAAIAERPERSIYDLPLIDAAERCRILLDWNDTATAYPRDAAIPDLFAMEAERRPRAPAIIRGEERVSYGALERRANRIARLLIRNGVGPETIVAVMDDRTPELFVWLVAIVKAGGAYLPIEPTLPAERIAYLLTDSRAHVLLTRTVHLQGRSLPPVNVVEVDAREAEIARESDVPPAVAIRPHNLAYVLYTSGSTGEPKGVAVTHRSVIRLVRDQNYISFGPDDRIAQLNTVAFDAATFEIWGALLNGGVLDIVDRDTVLSPRSFGAWLHDHAITASFVTAALFNRIVAEVPDAFRGVRSALVGGDAVDPSAAATVLAAGAPDRLVNGYGPTECTTFSVWHDIREVPPDATTVPIGMALANTTLYVLDRRLNPQPIGVPGELYIGGDALARGYLGRPDATAAAFVPDPFDRKGGARLYRTGDMVRRLESGVIEFIGRIDNQVKIRGFRIEPGEIEAALLSAQAVAEAAVVVQSDPGGGKRLVGYVVTQPGLTTTAAELRLALRAKLPDYMVPAALVLVEAMPLNANGKIDRARLPEPEAPVALPGSPLTPTEEVMAGLFAALLGHPSVGAEQDFFELGGHSLLATQAVSRIRDVFGVDLPLRQFFAGATVRDASCRVDALRQGERVAPPLARRDAAAPLALSFAQERMWLIDQIEDAPAVYNVAFGLKLAGHLDLDAADWAFNQILQRHEALRTLIAQETGRPVVAIAPHADRGISRIDLRGLPAAERDARLEVAVAVAAQRRFDLATGPLIEVEAITVDDDQYVLVVVAHHIAADGWSMGILAREFAKLYAARRQGTLARLPPLPVQYADFAAWQRSWLDGAPRAELLDYWGRHLDGAPPVLQLLTDRPRPPKQSFRGAVRSVRFDAPLLNGLKALGQGSGATLFMTLLAGFAALLNRCGAQDDLVIGTPVANRMRSEVEPLIGCFVNTLALRVDLGGEPSFGELLRRVRHVALDAYAHQDLPFEQLVDALQPERSLAHAPLFQVMFILQNAPFDMLSLPELEVSPYPVETNTAKYDLVLALEETPDGLAGGLEYSADLFDAATIDRLIALYRMLLVGIVADPVQPVTRLPLLTPAERERLTVAFNETAALAPRETTIHRMIERQATATPDTVALITTDARITYAALNERANRLARHLVACGVGAELPVGLCMTRTAELVIGLLAVLKAGGAYVALDPAYPVDRLATMIEEAQPPIVLTDRRAQSSLPTCAAKIVVADALPGEVAQLSGSDLGERSGAANLAYVLYTSGSTGRPKGVAVEHKSITALVTWARRAFGPEEIAGFLASSSVCFDASVFELFFPLSFGGTVILAENVLELPHLAARDQVTAIITVPSAIAALAQVNGIPASVRTLFLGGEQLKNALVQRLYAVPTLHAVYNLYGPSEDTTYSTFVLCPRGGDVEPPIGKPIDAGRVYILDRHSAPLPGGVPGELFLGGAGLSRGYYRRPDLTAERFVPDLFGPPGTRLYRTGDEARWLRGGSVAYLGRLDHQVKLRGFRIELGEIEAVLARHPAINDVAVVMREDETGQKRLVAYASLRTTIGAEELKSFLAVKLPGFMVPQDIVILPELPHTLSDKIDRRALPAPQSRERGAISGPLRDPKERILSDIWSAVLRVEHPGSDDNFFELGGDSIISLQVVARARQAGLVLTPKQVFEHQTLARLAAVAEPIAGSAVEQGPVVGDVHLTPIQHWLMARGLAAPQHFNQAVIIETAPLSAVSLAPILQHLTAHHDALRAAFRCRNGGWQQEIAPPAPVAVSETIDLSGVASADRPSAVAAVAERLHGGFDLAAPPLIKAALFIRGAAEPAWLLIVAHHLVVDGVSWRILLEDFATLSRQAIAGAPLALPEKTSSYRAWAASLHDRASNLPAAEIAHWCAWPSPAPALPRDHDVPTTANTTAASDSLTVTFSAETAAALLHDPARAYGMRPDEVLLVALAACLGAWCQSDAVVIDREGHGREEPEGLDLSRTVGWFTAIFPLRLLAPASDPATALKSIKEQVRAVPQGGIGYGLLRYLHPEADLRRRLADAPQAEVLFNYLGQFGSDGNTAFASLSSGQAIAPANRRSHLLEVTAVIAAGELAVHWTYCGAIHDRATIAKLADDFAARLQTLLQHCAAPNAGSYTPSDFPELDLDQGALDKLVAAIDEGEG